MTDVIRDAVELDTPLFAVCDCCALAIELGLATLWASSLATLKDDTLRAALYVV